MKKKTWFFLPSTTLKLENKLKFHLGGVDGDQLYSVLQSLIILFSIVFESFSLLLE